MDRFRSCQNWHVSLGRSWGHVRKLHICVRVANGSMTHRILLRHLSLLVPFFLIANDKTCQCHLRFAKTKTLNLLPDLFLDIPFIPVVFSNHHPACLNDKRPLKDESRRQTSPTLGWIVIERQRNERFCGRPWGRTNARTWIITLPRDLNQPTKHFLNVWFLRQIVSDYFSAEVETFVTDYFRKKSNPTTRTKLLIRQN